MNNNNQDTTSLQTRPDSNWLPTKLSDTIGPVRTVKHEIHGVDTPSPQAITESLDITGRILAVKYPGNEIRLYDALNGNALGEYRFDTRIVIFASSSPEEIDVLLDDGQFWSISNKSKNLVKNGKVNEEIMGKYFFRWHYGSRKILCRYLGTLLSVDPQTGNTEQVTQLDEQINAISYAKRPGPLILLQVGNNNSTLVGWNLVTNSKQFTLKLDEKILSAAGSGSGDLVAVHSESGVCVYSVEGAKLTRHKMYGSPALKARLVPMIADFLEFYGYIKPDIYKSFLDESGKMLINKASIFFGPENVLFIFCHSNRYVRPIRAIIRIDEDKVLCIPDALQSKVEERWPEYISDYMYVRLHNEIVCVDINKMLVAFSIAQNACIEIKDTAVSAAVRDADDAIIYCNFTSGEQSKNKNICFNKLLCNSIEVQPFADKIFKISPDGNFLAVEIHQTVITGDRNHKVILLSAQSGEVIQTIGHDDWVNCGDFAHNGQHFLVGCDNSVERLADAGCVIEWEIGPERREIRRIHFGKTIANLSITVVDSAIIQTVKTGKIGSTNSGDLVQVSTEELYFLPVGSKSPLLIQNGTTVVANRTASLVCIRTKVGESEYFAILKLTKSDCSETGRIEADKVGQVLAVDCCHRLVGLKDDTLTVHDLLADSRATPVVTNIKAPLKKAFFMEEERLLVTVHTHHITFWNYANTIDDNDPPPGTELATCTLFNNGEVWTTPPDEVAPNGWFYTTRPELISVRSCNENGTDSQVLEHDDPNRKMYLELFNDKRMVMDRLNNWQRYRQEVEKRKNQRLIHDNLFKITAGAALLQIGFNHDQPEYDKP